MKPKQKSATDLDIAFNRGNAPPHLAARKAGAIEALEAAIKLLSNFDKETALVRLNNLLRGYKRS